MLKYRTIIENSGMINNDEVVYYTEEPQTNENFKNRFVLCRPIFEIEKKDGLTITSKEISTFNEVVPISTHIIDALYKMKRNFDAVEILFKDKSISKKIAHYLADNYYDCMSGGCSVYGLLICEWIIKNCPNIDMNIKVYPSNERWVTLTDFLKEQERHREMMSNYRKEKGLENTNSDEEKMAEIERVLSEIKILTDNGNFLDKEQLKLPD